MRTIPTLLASFVMLALAAPNSHPQTKDYLGPELRAKVEQLKKDVARERTTLDTVRPRLWTVWEWANAFALQGGTLPVELPMTAGLVFGREFQPGRQGIPLDPIIFTDRYVRELSIREENPNAIGALTSSAIGPMMAGTYQTIAQTYTVGDMPMAEGGGILLAKHFMSNQGNPASRTTVYQTDDPAADSYVTVKSSNPDARFETDAFTMAGMHGGFRSASQSLVFRLKGTALKKGDTITITCGDRSGGSKGFRVQTYSNDRFPLPIYVDLEATDDFFTLPIFPHRIVGGPTAGVHGFAPSVVGVGEKFDVSIRSEDQYYNRASESIPGYVVSVNGNEYKTIPSGADAITVLKDVAFDAPGVYRFDIRSADGKIAGIANPVWVQEGPTRRVFWGETHAHCGWAEGQGTADGFFEFGRDDAKLDFLTLSEHDLWLDDFEWSELAKKVKQYHNEGSFITILGYEWTQDTNLGGHHNVFFRTPEDRKRVNIHRAKYLTELWQGLRAENDLNDVVVIPHAHEAGEWRISDPGLEKLVEIMSMHGTFEWYGQKFLEQGHRVGFVAASDDHLSHPGYSGTLPRGLFQRGGLAALITPEKTNDAIFDAMRNLSAYATTGERIILDVSVNGAAMGQRIAPAENRVIKGRAIGTEQIDTITLVKNGEDLRSEDFLTATSGKATRYVVGFWSPSDPQRRAIPRPSKTWSGTVHVRGAKLARAAFPTRDNVYSDSIAIAKDDPNAVEFTVTTRGQEQSIVLELDGAGTDTAVDVDVKPGVEWTPGTAVYIPLMDTLGFSASFPLAKLENGRAHHDVHVRHFVDRVSVRAIKDNVPMDHEFEFSDSGAVDDADNYYVRITQLGGGTAWSSPVWVGGFSTR